VRNDGVIENALSILRIRRSAAIEVIGFAGGHAVTQLLGKQGGQIRTAYCSYQQGLIFTINEIRKVAGAISIRGHTDFSRIDALRLAHPLVVRENEKLVAAQRTTEGSPILVLAEGTARRRKIIARIQICVAQEVECAAMPYPRR
jgi:hypothetical protein